MGNPVVFPSTKLKKKSYDRFVLLYIKHYIVHLIIYRIVFVFGLVAVILCK